ncbi:hypothetical protein CR194_17435 [Salipaludibacillus keqinensis]|uniref:Uncharacterized protein n=1 Tax=Salipaludibacillus keqinensis TaxID=2045207 RepID=A0A323T8F6_9BACI|nr:hypothetical protein [Salipaludibacillus keqinensis]PYZ91981.1 hypothetical protein CR194_17435 [Salipaludibacillus keqinensis]
MYYRPIYAPHYYRNRQYPPVDISIFQQSLQTYPSLLSKADQVIDSLRNSPDKMHRIMEAAQAGQDNEVEEIINEAGTSLNVSISYTPMSMTLTFTDAPQSALCCRLTMYIRWG